MASINFTVFVDKILSGEKKQTISPVGKHVYRPGDRLYLYGYRITQVKGYFRLGCQEKVKNYVRRTRQKLGEAVCSKVVPIRLDRIFNHIYIVKIAKDGNHWHFTNKNGISIGLAKADGFNNYSEFEAFFINTYKLKPGDSKEMVIIKWKNFKHHIGHANNMVS